MSVALTWLAGLIARRRARMLATTVGAGLAVALLASIGSFIAGAQAAMTARSAARVAVDWQVEAAAGANPGAVLKTVRGWPGTMAAQPVEYATTTGLSATTGGSTQTTGGGVVVGIPSGYAATFPGELRPLSGTASGVLLSQQAAANLHAGPGDTVSVGRPGLPPVSVRVSGVTDLPQADSLFQAVAAPAGTGPSAPPDNVMILPSATWHQLFDEVGATRPGAVRHQVHVRVSHALPSSPVDAYAEVTSEVRNLELRLAGAGRVGDNLGATLGAARSDALYAQVLFLFLGLPGAVLAGLLTATVAGAGAERRRREQALLRTRGASPGLLLSLALAEAAVVAAAGIAAGLAAALVIGNVAFGSSGFGADAVTAALWGGGAAVAGLLVTASSILVPAWRDARRLTVAAARAEVGRARQPGWSRYVLDAALLAGAAAVFAQTGQRGYELLLVPEGVPQVSMSYWALAGPLLLWAGVGLLVRHLAEDALARSGRLRGVLRPMAGGLAGTVAASLRAQRRLLARAVAMVALTVAFAVSTAVFNATYEQQARVDALLTNGADVRVDEPAGTLATAADAGAIQSTPGVAGVEPLEHRFAYVGADLQDLYGVRPSTVVDATRLQDAYFSGGTARELIGRLAARPDAILVSAETARDFQLNPGDSLNLRLQRPGGEYVPVRFVYAGIVKEFPTAPKDSFLVANADYVARSTGSAAIGSFLVDTGGSSPSAVAQRLRPLLGPSVHVTDIQSGRALIGSSLTAVDLAGLTRVELGFAVVLAIAAAGLTLALGMVERRRTFALAAALGSRLEQLAAFVWSEAGVVGGIGIVLGAVASWAVTEMLVGVLTGVFDPPPSTLAVPWPYIVAVAALALAAIAAAALVTLSVSARSIVSVLRDL
jgi:putative ABC transport system permease protein